MPAEDSAPETTSYPDGSTMEVFADGRVIRRHPGVVWTIAIDGTTTLERDDGSGTTLHSDGTRTEVDSAGTRHEFDADGNPADPVGVRTASPGGSVRTVSVSGAEILTHLDGNRTIIFPDGSTSRHTTGGAIERKYRDAVWTLALDGTTAIESADGSTTLIHPDGSRTDTTAAGEVSEYPSEVRLGLVRGPDWEEDLSRQARQIPLPLIGAGLALAILAIIALVMLIDSGSPPRAGELGMDGLTGVPEVNQDRYCEVVLAVGEEVTLLDSIVFGNGSSMEADTSFTAVIDGMAGAAELSGSEKRSQWEQHQEGMEAYRAAYVAAGYEVVEYESNVTEEVATAASDATAFVRGERDSCLEFTLLKGSDDQAGS
ncbi:MAG: hypothetical protein JJLCMIEE_00244 [Acidimicrobiales bacterium]|nr:MAG: hypothetical protein EDR02_01490 [Actinomycetota bacterium]MBV6507203.1 hypothetical protein [Acidimicrobiales bacterium]RIK05511.1 MAG: hypothetical protein DCC48_09440 [Acidobacteriota bacterium]